jgi:hypothetical protein
MQDFELENQLAMQRYQQALAEQNKPFVSPQGKMVGNIYVRSNPLEGLIQGLRMKQSKDELAASRQELKDLRGKRQETEARDMSAFVSALRGTPAQASTTTPTQMPSFDEADAQSMQGVQGYGATTGAQTATPGDPMAAYSLAAASQSPTLRKVGLEGTMSLANEQAKLQAAQTLQQKYIDILRTSKTPQDALAAGVPFETVKNFTESKNLGREKVEFKDTGGKFVPVTQYGEIPTGVAALDKTGNPFSDLILNQNGQMVPNKPLVGAKQSIAKAGATTVDARNFNTQESEQSKSYGKTLGDIRGKITQAGFDAPKQLAKLDRMETLLQGIDGGAAAPTLAQIASTANSFGIKLDKNLGPKEAAIALAVNMASGLREPGTGPMTDKDFDNFLKQVPDLSKSAEGRKAIMTTLRAATQRDLQAAQFSREYAKRNNGVIDDNFFDAMANFYAQNPVVNIPMPETNARGNQFRVVR